jgi:hydroxymethylpyrimidine/phosphomethylpyrimidine kinase
MDAPRIIWTIAGFDPSNGAGVTADLRTMASLGCHGVAAITALTIQNTLGVRRVEPVQAGILAETLQTLLEDLPPAAIKIGMLATAENASTVASFLQALPQPCPIVLDPILLASSGAALLTPEGVAVLRDRLLPLATIVTPNRAEAAALTGLPGTDAEAMALALRRMGCQAAVVTGGDHLESDTNLADSATDVLAYQLGSLECVEGLRAPRIASRATHGTGCAFSSALACELAKGASIPQAVTRAKAYVRRAIQTAPGLGHGRGPLGLEDAGRD